MNFSALHFTATSLTLLGGALFAIGVGLWWIIKKRQKVVWLPILRILPRKHLKLPKLELKKPPMVPFLCFLLCGALVLFHTSRPKEKITIPFDPKKSRVHFFFDYSPSVSGVASLEDMQQHAIEVYESLGEPLHVNVSTSHSVKVSSIHSQSELQEYLKRFSFHRGGIDLAEAMKKQESGIGDVDQLFLFSDRDTHSWKHFNWQFFNQKSQVIWVDVAGQQSNRVNYFFNKVQFVSNQQAIIWDLEIGRRGEGLPQAEGRVVATWRDKEISSENWNFAPEKEKISIRMTLPQEAFRGMKEEEKQLPLVWRLETGTQDAISLDNSFRTALRGNLKSVYVVADSLGEEPLEDPIHYFKMALESIGVQIFRHDWLNRELPPQDRFPLWVLIGGSTELASYCPKLEWKKENGSIPKVWLLPHSPQASYEDLCRCYLQLTENNSQEICAESIDAKSFAHSLQKLDASPMGGTIEEQDRALAWVGKNSRLGFQVLAYVLPLSPSDKTGISHANLPLLVRDILNYQGFFSQNEGKDAFDYGWSRIEDLTKEILWESPERTLSEREQEMYSNTNIPLGESLMENQANGWMPPRFEKGKSNAMVATHFREDDENPLPWIKLITWLVSMLFFIEGLWLFFFKKKHGKAVSTIVLLVLGFFPQSSKADVSNIYLSLVGPTEYFGGKINDLSKQVSQRTSVKLSAESSYYTKIDTEALEEPWLWVNSPSLLIGKDGAMREDIVRWLKRGGFLIIESFSDRIALDRLTAPLSAQSKEIQNWSPIPPDHELMRSFYLLDSLPICNGSVWYGFTYDKRLAILAVPFPFYAAVKDAAERKSAVCEKELDFERATRIFVNLAMVALATDYKKDQIHMREILKRLQ